MLRVLAISGSLRRGSHNAALLKAATPLLPPGSELAHWSGLALLPAYSEDEDGDAAPAGVAELRDALSDADALLIATPEYNASAPGALKNALDWASRPFPANALRGKPAAVIGASTGMFGAVWAQAELRKVLQTIGARVIDVELGVGYAHERFDDRGRLVDDDLRGQLAAVVTTLVESVLPDPWATVPA
jgi:chromate reductase, NAD(P)H dehydrogenase (quinone)